MTQLFLHTRTLEGLLQIGLSKPIVPLQEESRHQLTSCWRTRVSEQHREYVPHDDSSQAHPVGIRLSGSNRIQGTVSWGKRASSFKAYPARQMIKLRRCIQLTIELPCKFIDCDASLA